MLMTVVLRKKCVLILEALLGYAKCSMFYLLTEVMSTWTLQKNPSNGLVAGLTFDSVEKNLQSTFCNEITLKCNVCQKVHCTLFKYTWPWSCSYQFAITFKGMHKGL